MNTTIMQILSTPTEFMNWLEVNNRKHKEYSMLYFIRDFLEDNKIYCRVDTDIFPTLIVIESGDIIVIEWIENLRNKFHEPIIGRITALDVLRALK